MPTLKQKKNGSAKFMTDQKIQKNLQKHSTQTSSSMKQVHQIACGHLDISWDTNAILCEAKQYGSLKVVKTFSTCYNLAQ